MRLPNLLATRRGRLVAFFFLYVTEGIPLGFAATAIATQLRRQDVGPAEIGAFVASFYLPWAFKWAFGPVIDVFSSERLGRRRGWILGTQLMLILTLLACTTIQLPAQLGLLTAVLLIHNSFGAMQDVAIDALAVTTLHPDERGLANGMMFGGAAIGQGIGGSGVLFLMPVLGVAGGFVFVAACIALVTVFIVLPLQEPATPLADRREGGLGAAVAAMKAFSAEAFRSFLGTRGAYVGMLFSLLPAGAMGLGLALQSNLAVEVGMSDDSVAWLALWTQVISAVFMVVGGQLSDRWGRRRTLGVYLSLMSLPALYMMGVLLDHQWVMPVPQNAAEGARRVAPAALVTAVWVATLTYSVAQGLMYGTRSALLMDVTNPKVAATQFTAYMAMMNLVISYSAAWQGIAIETLGYPKTLLIDAITGLLCVALLPWIKPSTVNEDGHGAARARRTAWVLAIGCLAWLPYRSGLFSAGAAAPMFETLFTLVFVAAAVFLATGSMVLGAAAGRLGRLGLWLAPLLLAMYLRKWWPQAGALYLLVPALAAGVLLAQARQAWSGLKGAGAVPATAALA
ncbi:Major Facilitator Superfamily transporter [Burkholderiales bacterium JOSHI_001]|nr:Major Facilitator Superfamily transporter [Burkholderiales bacterium JOSHI_001]